MSCVMRAPAFFSDAQMSNKNTIPLMEERGNEEKHDRVSEILRPPVPDDRCVRHEGHGVFQLPPAPCRGPFGLLSVRRSLAAHPHGPVCRAGRGFPVHSLSLLLPERAREQADWSVPRLKLWQ